MQTEQIAALAQLMMNRSYQAMKPSQKDTAFEGLLEQKTEAAKPMKKPDVVEKPEQKNPVEEGNVPAEDTGAEQAPETPDVPEEATPIVGEAEMALAALLGQTMQIVPAVEVAEQAVAPTGDVQLVEMLSVETMEAGMQEDVGLQQAVQQPVEMAEGEAKVVVQPQATTAVPVEEQPEQLQQDVTSIQQPAAEKVQTAEQSITVEKVVQQAAPEAGEQNAEIELEESPVMVENKPLFRQEDVGAVKVAEAEQPVDTRAADLDKQLAQRIATLQQVGDKVTIHLNPHNLGAITVELVQSGEHVGVLIHTETTKATELLKNHADQLSALLQDRTGNQTTVLIQQDARAQEQQNFDGHNQQNHQQEQQRQQQQRRPEDFMQQLRLGLIDVAEAAEA